MPESTVRNIVDFSEQDVFKKDVQDREVDVLSIVADLNVGKSSDFKNSS